VKGAPTGASAEADAGTASAMSETSRARMVESVRFRT
jgi:hypothetical protein